MTLKEAYKRWSQQKENQSLFTATKSTFNKVWSKLPFWKECSDYTEDMLANTLSRLSLKYTRADKVKASSMLIHIIEFGMGVSCGFSYSSIVSKADEIVTKPKEEPKKKNQDIFKPLVYNDKPLIQEEMPKKKIRKLKPLYQLDSDGIVIKEWPNVRQVSKELGIKEATLYKAISTGSRMNGYFWSRTKELIDEDKVTVRQPKVRTMDQLLNQLNKVVNEIRERGFYINITINL